MIAGRAKEKEKEKERPTAKREKRKVVETTAGTRAKPAKEKEGLLAETGAQIAGRIHKP